MSSPSNTEALQSLTQYAKASYAYIALKSNTPNQTCEDIIAHFSSKEMKAAHPKRIAIWDCVEGLKLVDFNNPRTRTPAVTLPNKLIDPAKLLTWIKEIKPPATSNESGWLILVQNWHFFDNYVLKQMQLNLEALLNTSGIMMVTVGCIARVPEELSKNTQILRWQLPNDEELGEILDYIVASLRKAKKDDSITIPVDVRFQLILAAKGFTQQQAGDAFSLAAVKHGPNFGDLHIQTVFEEKTAQMQKELLTNIPVDSSFKDIGGLEGMEYYIKTRSKAYTQKAKDYGLSYPKGILLCGTPGTGKTLLAKGIAHAFKMPLFQLDVGRLFGSQVGQTEQNTRRVLEMMDALGMCVVLIDEVEKSLNANAVSGNGDTGVSSRLFGTLLTWLAEHKTPVFLIATSNNFEQLPPELLRAGRFDGLFYIEAPDKAGRKKIFEIHINKKKRDVAKFDLERLATESTDYTGAEIELAISDAMFNCFDQDRDIDTDAILKALLSRPALAKSNSDALAKLHEKARKLLTFVSEMPTETPHKASTATVDVEAVPATPANPDAPKVKKTRVKAEKINL